MVAKTLFIGTPCQVTAVHYGRLLLAFLRDRYPGKALTWPKSYPELSALAWIDEIAITVSVFCAGLFPYRGFEEELIKSGIPLEHKLPPIGILPRGIEACKVCQDFDGEMADISFGPFGVPQGWTALVTRSKIGLSLLESAVGLRSLEVGSELSGKDLIARIRGKRRDIARAKSKANALQLPPLFYESGSVSWQDIPSDSLLQDFYTIKDLVRNGMCSFCGICASICPKKSISLQDGTISFSGACNTHVCGLCFALCPQQHIIQGVEQNRIFAECAPISGGAHEAEVHAVRANGTASVTVAEKLLGAAIEKGLASKVVYLHFRNESLKGPFGKAGAP